MENLKEYGALITSIIGVFAIIATMTPNENDNKIVSILLKVINLAGLNVGKAKNRDY